MGRCGFGFGGWGDWVVGLGVRFEGSMVGFLGMFVFVFVVVVVVVSVIVSSAVAEIETVVAILRVIS